MEQTCDKLEGNRRGLHSQRKNTITLIITTKRTSDSQSTYLVLISIKTVVWIGLVRMEKLIVEHCRSSRSRLVAKFSDASSNFVSNLTIIACIAGRQVSTDDLAAIAGGGSVAI